ncbi:MAG TPA: histidine kinase, partial [Sedimentisphaerales bacterium]|nr:histidine kinase [Sedimentisphaerales bacterium]
MHFIRMTALLVLILPVMSAFAKTNTPLKALSLPRLEQRLATIDSDLEQLAHYSLRSGIGAIGYRSWAYKTAKHMEWVEIELDRDYPIQEIVLVPTIWRDTKKGFQSDGFPAAFRILAGTIGDHTGTVVAEYHSTDDILPRIASLVIPINEVAASWVRVEAMRLSTRAFDRRHVFQLAELLVFSGTENVALRQPVKTSSNQQDIAGAWDQRFLVDGFLPYLMDSAQGSQSLAYVSVVGEKPILTLDLGQPYPLSRIHLHAIDQSDTVPQAHAGDLGIPHHLRIEGASRPDFSDAAILLDVLRENIYDTGPIMMWRISEHTCRYVRFFEVESDYSPEIRPGQFRIGFAEIELFSKGTNVALNKPVQASSVTREPFRSLTSLTDGYNLYGRILPVRNWVEQLALRHDLETERPQVLEELSRRYARQKTNLTWMSWLAALLTAGIGFTFLIDRILRLREIAQIKERFAADLHDELGADLHTIGLLGELIEKKAVDLPKDIEKCLHQIRAVSKRSGIAVRHFINRQDDKELYTGLIADMQRAAQRIVVDLEQDITIEGEEVLNRLKPRARADLFLFYKECLINICRHSGATQLDTHLTATKKEIHLTISDNGRGI